MRQRLNLSKRQSLSLVRREFKRFRGAFLPDSRCGPSDRAVGPPSVQLKRDGQVNGNTLGAGGAAGRGNGAQGGSSERAASRTSSRCRPQHGTSGGEAAALHAGMEGILQVGTNVESLAWTRRMVAPPAASDSAQALETWNHHTSRIAETWGCALGGPTNSGKQLPICWARGLLPL